MAKYRIRHGETGFDLFKDNCPFSMGFASRQAAAVAADEDRKLEAARSEARAYLSRVRDALRADFALSEGDVRSIMSEILQPRGAQ